MTLIGSTKVAKVVLTYTYEGAPNYLGATVTADGVPDLTDPDNGGITPEITAFAATTSVPQDGDHWRHS